MAQLVKIEAAVDEKELQQYVKEQLDVHIRETLFLWDIETMIKMTCMSRAFLEEHFLKDERMKLLERRRTSGKKWWFYSQSVEVMTEIMDEW